MTLAIPRAADSDGPGPSWNYLKTNDGLTAWLKCPNGHTTSVDNHTIDANGKVSPSVVCPGWPGIESCDWHVFIHLVGWNPRVDVEGEAP